ncbi:hypothetical protein P154DRAFT_425284 [Amniculicola lignicola CBS 123094]|uniref:Cupin type-1 domain-containing protein n=1 Tax=Amniculicola lignicola CBS 123094 TaxID=1392246 RepID=A0A6A5WYS4_9PLEO|nr:hypothetical protein P154DRAFT_425284 [Amniculicola lignicola CBS 123094]
MLITRELFLTSLLTFRSVDALPHSGYLPSLSAALSFWLHPGTPVASTPAAFAPSVSATPAAAHAMFIQQEVINIDASTALSAIGRFRLLLASGGQSVLPTEELSKATVFDFNKAVPLGNGGALKPANMDTFPILTDLRIASTIGFIDPCGMNTPHIHPRSAGFNTVVEGRLEFGYVLENNLMTTSGSGLITGSLDRFQSTVFPMGAIHYGFNPNYERAVFVAGFNSADLGVEEFLMKYSIPIVEI